MISWFLFGVMCMLVVLFVAASWKLLQLSHQVKQAWYQLENNLKNRAELMDTLVVSVDTWEELDRAFIKKLAQLKTRCRQTATLQERARCERQVTQSFKKIFTAAFNHPELSQDNAFVSLRENIIKAQGKVQRSQRKYNSLAREFNLIASIIPLNVIARMFELDEFEYFDPAPAARLTKKSAPAPHQK